MNEIIANMPEKSGVYFFLNDGGKILYIGKAVNLKKRMQSHFRKGKQKIFKKSRRDREYSKILIPTVWDVKMKQLNDMERIVYNKQRRKKTRIISETRRIEYILTENDDEALTLEGCLISAIRPELNRAVWRYPFIEITIGEEIPRVLTCYQALLPESYIYGPFNIASDIDLAVDGFLRIIPICNNLAEIKPNSRYPLSCLRHQVDRCLAPCKKTKFSKEEYNKNVQYFISELESGGKGIIKSLTKLMEEEIDSENFEGAAAFRDRIKAIERLFAARAMPVLISKYYQQIKTIIGENYHYQGIIDRILANNSK